MKLLALTINGVPIGVGGTDTIANNAGRLGANLYGSISFMFIFIIVIVSFLFMVYGGIKWIISSGEEKNVEGAQRIIINASIGLAIAMLSYFFLNIASVFLGFKLLGG